MSNCFVLGSVNAAFPPAAAAAVSPRPRQRERSPTTASAGEGLLGRRSDRLQVVTSQSVEDGQVFPHCSDDGDHLELPSGDQPLVEIADDRVVAAGDEGGIATAREASSSRSASSSDRRLRCRKTETLPFALTTIFQGKSLQRPVSKRRLEAPESWSKDTWSGRARHSAAASTCAPRFPPRHLDPNQAK